MQKYITVVKISNAEFRAVCQHSSAAVPMSTWRRRPKLTCM